MIQKIIVVVCAFLWCGFTIMAQEPDKKVAVFDPAGEVDNTIKEIVREEISSVIVNIVGFTVLERQLINKVLEENKFQMGGLVDESQISEIGKRIGANYVFVSSVSKFGDNYYISCKMIEVLTARIERQKTGQTKNDTEDLLEVTQRVVKSMFGIYVPETESNKKPTDDVTNDKVVENLNKAVGNVKSIFSKSKDKDKINNTEKREQIITQNPKSNIQIWNPDGIEMIYVEVTGSKSFYIGKYEVTQGQWTAVMGSNPSKFRINDNYPVENVSWNDVQSFITNLNKITGKKYRLPTEKEWEYAARGGKFNSNYDYSGDKKCKEVAWYDQKSTSVVGAKKPNALGIYDMSGNVYEWCEDWFNGNHKENVLRGGSIKTGEKECRVDSRHGVKTGTRDASVGFRLICD